MLNRVRQQCQCCAQGWDAKRPETKRQCCAVGKCCHKVPNPARVHHVFRTLRAALGVAVAEEVLTRNVASFAKPTRPRRHRFETWSVAEATTFLAAIREHRLYALFAVAIALGMRRGEALGLRWEDVDLVDGTVTMAMQLQRVAGKLRHDETKTDDSTVSSRSPGHACKRCGDTEHSKQASGWQLATDGRTRVSCSLRVRAHQSSREISTARLMRSSPRPM